MKKILLLFLFVVISFTSSAKEAEDTLRVYQLGDISVTGTSLGSILSKSDMESVDFKTIRKSDVQSFSELQTYLPSARIKVNSRGESLIFLRGAGERQIGLFFDGVPLNIAWDNRFDLSLLPTDIVAKIDVNKNGNSILYGPNVLGGALNISSYERDAEGFGGQLRFQGGEAGMYQAAVSNDGRIGNFNYLVSLDYLNTEGFLLSQNTPDSLTNQNYNSSLRTNTDREFLSLYGRAEYKFSEHNKLGFSVLSINGEKGVAPETDKDSNHTRYWRYPDWKRTLLAVNGQAQLSNNGEWMLKGTFWYDIFKQQIDSYTGISYETVKEMQKDKDNTFGTRLNLSWNINDFNTLGFVFNWFYSNHNEAVTEFNFNPSGPPTETNEFSQNILSPGLEYQYAKNNVSLRAGALFDHFVTGKAGHFTEAEGNTVSDYGFYVNPNLILTDNIALFLNITRRTRFPTLRESYSGALGKFIVNPDLKPETGWLNEIGINYSGEYWAAELAVFANLYSDMITKVRLSADEDSLRRYMRINYADVNIYGVDVSFAVNPFRNFSAKVNFTYMDANNEMEGLNDAPVENKPDILAGVVVSYTFDFGLGFQVESQTVGKQFQRSPENKKVFVELEGTTIFNARIGYRLPELFNTSMELYVRVNNIADTYREYQLGLPEPGRMMQAGLLLGF
jgi:iron complex outermembrane receptor protein